MARSVLMPGDSRVTRINAQFPPPAMCGNERELPQDRYFVTRMDLKT